MVNLDVRWTRLDIHIAYCSFGGNALSNIPSLIRSPIISARLPCTSLDQESVRVFSFIRCSPPRIYLRLAFVARRASLHCLRTCAHRLSHALHAHDLAVTFLITFFAGLFPTHARLPNKVVIRPCIRAPPLLL